MNDYAGLREAPEAMTDEEVAGMFQYWHNEHGTSGGDLIRRVEKQAFDKWTAYAAALLAEVDRLRETIRALEGERDSMREDAAKLAAFAYAVMGDWPDVGGLDGFDLQALGEKHGVLEKVERVAPCGEFCQCAEYETGPVECFRLTPMVTSARIKGVAP